MHIHRKRLEAEVYLIDDAKVVDEADADNGNPLLFAEHAAGDQGDRHSNPTPS